MLTLCDSVAVRILPSEEVIAGIGNELRIFKKGNEPGPALQWKLRSKVHGIDANGSRILVYGEREFIILDHNGEPRLTVRGKISDWISSGKLLDGDSINICLVTSHSVALRLSSSGTSDEINIDSRSSCSDKSTIYCSTIVGSNSNDCIVFAGTAFGEVFIWKPIFKKGNLNISTREPIQHRLSCHNGVIFSIDVDLGYGLLTTTSDDRSVRFYKISQDVSVENSVANFAKSKITPIRNVYGHNARVFKAKIISIGDKPFVISAGEDSFICIWDENGELLFKRRHHFGATIWDFDFDSESKVLFSSGSDGNIISYNLEECFSPIQAVEVKSNLLVGEYLAKVSFLDRGFLVGVTNHNKLVYRKNHDWQVVDGFSAYKCTCLVVYGKQIATAGYRIVTLFKVDENDQIVKMFEKSVVSGVIRTICFLSESEILVSDDKGECKYSANGFEESMIIPIPTSKEPWITAALKHDTFLILSTRQGSLLLYKQIEVGFLQTFTLKQIHGHLGVTHMHFEQDFQGYFSVRTAGHDGTIKTVKIYKDSNRMSIAVTESVPIAWIEKAFKTPSEDNYIVGFNDNHFVIWTTKTDVVFQVACGGGHRCWDIWFDYVQDRAELIFIKNKQLFRVNSKLNHITNEYRIPYSSWHCNSCNVVQTVQTGRNNIILISGGEDNLLKFSQLNTGKPDEIQLLRNISRHVSSIKDIAIVREENDLLVFSVGGRAQICVTEMSLDTYCVEERAQFMLKSSDMDRRYQRDTQQVDFDPETRFMSISIVDCSTHQELYLGCSDGYIRKFVYKESKIEMCEAVFYNRCVLHTKILNLNSECYLLSAATDGWVCFWTLHNFNDCQQPVFKVKHHESGINSLDAIVCDNLLRIATGGDDQRVAFSDIGLESNQLILKSTKHLDNHTAQVNGVRMSSCSRFLYSTSIDQTICKVDLEAMKVEARIKTCIADVKGLVVVPTEQTNLCIFYGWGVQICPL